MDRPEAPGRLIRAEIAEQPDLLERTVRERRAEISEVARALAARRHRFVLLAGRGTSDHAALYAKYLVEVRLGLPAGLMSPSTITAYGSRPALDDVLVIAVSQSGGSPDLLETATIARGCGATVLAVTNAPGSALACAADLHLGLDAGAELAVAATKTYTAELMVLWLLVDLWRGGTGDEALSVGPAADRALALTPRVAELAARLRFTERLVTTGRGYAYPTAREAALKLAETCHLPAHAFSGADLLHGPVAMLDRQHPVLAVVPDGQGARAMAPVLERLRATDVDLTVVGGPQSVRPESPGLLVDHGLREDLSPMVDIVVLQCLSLTMALERGLDPDRPPGLTKVTRTW